MSRDSIRYSLFLIKQNKNRITFESVYHYLGIVILATVIGTNVYTEVELMNHTIPSVMIVIACAASVYLIFCRQSLVIDKATKTVRFRYSSIFKKLEWKKGFNQFREVLLRQIRVKDMRNWNTYRYNLIFLDGKDNNLSIRLKPPVLGFFFSNGKINNPGSNKEFCQKLAAFLDIPFTEMYE